MMEVQDCKMHQAANTFFIEYIGTQRSMSLLLGRTIECRSASQTASQGKREKQRKAVSVRRAGRQYMLRYNWLWRLERSLPPRI